MKYGLYILLVFIFLCGCKESRTKKKFSTEINASELIASQQVKQTEETTTGLLLYCLQLGRYNLAEIYNFAKDCNNIAVEYSNSQLFIKNGLLCSIGSSGDWQQLIKICNRLDVGIKKSTALQSTIQRPDDIAVSNAESFWLEYYDKNSASNILGFTQGSLNLHLVSEEVIGRKQLCQLTVIPVYKNKKNTEQFIFDTCLCKTRLEQGSFLMLCPSAEPRKSNKPKLISDELFYNTKTPDIANIYLILCSSIKDAL